MNQIGYRTAMSDLPALPPPIPEFVPVPRKSLKGFTPDRQRQFIAALAGTASVASAADYVGISRQAAYLLRAAPGAESFAAAWDKAVRLGIAALRSIAFDRAIHGEPVPVFHNGEQVGTRTQHNNQLLMRLLTHYDPQGGEPAAKTGDGASFPFSNPNVERRIDSHLKPTNRLSDEDFARNGEWATVENFRKQVRDLHLVAQVRLWLREKRDDPFGTVLAHLDHYERQARANPMFTGAMVDDVLATGMLSQPWLETASLARLIEKAEVVEAMAFMVKHKE